MKNWIVIALSTLLFTPYLQAETATPNLKLDAEVSEMSLKYQLNGYPTKKIDNAYWASKDLPLVYRYLHTMLVTAFFSERADQLQAARLWLGDYQCENIMACTQEQSFLDGVMKAYALILKKKELSLLKKIQNQVDDRVRKFKSQKPATNGLCNKNAEREKWFSLAYELYCPGFKTLMSQGGLENMITESLLRLTEQQSGQIIMSSSRILHYKHEGDIDCETPWIIQLECESVSKTTYKLNCEKTKASTKVACTEQKK